MRVDFEFKNKGKAIPPDASRHPDESNYVEVDPSPDAHIIQDAEEGQY